jgi:PAS domain S-box-containing protein
MTNEERINQCMTNIVLSSTDAMISIDIKGIIQTANPATERMFGYTQDELIGSNISILMPNPIRDQHDSFIRRFRETGKQHILGTGREVNCRRKDGSIFPASANISQVDHLGLFTGILHDVSQRRALQLHVLEISAEEHRKIGQELHDGVQQELTGFSLMMGALLDNLLLVNADQELSSVHSKALSKAIEIAEKLSDGFSQSASRVRQLAHGIMPVHVDPSGLRSALHDLAQRTNLVPGVSCHFICEQSLTLPDNTTATNLYRIVQEAIANALRHSHASSISISLEMNNGALTLIVTDNGRGFDVQQIQSELRGKSERLGLRTMEYRANTIGGELYIESVISQGTRIVCLLPRGAANVNS